MKKIIYGIYDATAAKYTFLGVADSENLLVRDLSIVVNSGDKASILVNAPEDHKCCLLGFINDDTAQVEVCERRVIAELRDLKHE